MLPFERKGYCDDGRKEGWSCPLRIEQVWNEIHCHAMIVKIPLQKLIEVQFLGWDHFADRNQVLCETTFRISCVRA